jgi:tyrosine-specific transport protein
LLFAGGVLGLWQSLRFFEIKTMLLRYYKILGSALLIAGTTMGAGMLAIPVTTGIAGSIPAYTIILLAFLFMLISIFLLLETLYYYEKPQVNIISVFNALLGKRGSLVAWIAFLLLLYSVLAAYITGGGELLSTSLRYIDIHLSGKISAILFAVGFGLLIYTRARGIDYLNQLLMLAFVSSFITLIVIVLTNSQLHPIQQGDIKFVWAAIPVVVLAFTSHIILPSLKLYLQDVSLLKKATLFGTCIPLLCYLIWQTLLIGALPADGLSQVASSENSVTAIAAIIGVPSIVIIVFIFSFFALLTSYLGATLSMVDFLADGLQIRRTPVGITLLLLLSLVLPLIFALYYPHGFVMALGYAGVFVAVLYTILPALAVWRARYHLKLTAPYRLPGGKPILILVMLGGLVIISLQIAVTLGWVPTISSV